MRSATIQRKTAETDINLTLTLDGTGKSEINTGCGVLDHMLTLFAKHSRMDLTLTCKGDTYVDDHHTVEDIGICLGMAIAEALGEKRGINRYGSTVLPMDEALILSAVDLSGRAMLVYVNTLGNELPFRRADIGRVQAAAYLLRYYGAGAHLPGLFQYPPCGMATHCPGYLRKPPRI